MGLLRGSSANFKDVRGLHVKFSSEGRMGHQIRLQESRKLKTLVKTSVNWKALIQIIYHTSFGLVALWYTSRLEIHLSFYGAEPWHRHRK